MTQGEFETAGHETSPSFLGELLEFLAHNRKWWLGPIVLVLLGFAALVLFSGSAAAPFIYTLF